MDDMRVITLIIQITVIFNWPSEHSMYKQQAALFNFIV